MSFYSMSIDLCSQVPEERTQATRLLLELHAGSPVILLPVSSQSPEILVVDLGKLSVNNSFCYAGSEGTISSVRQQSEDRTAAKPLDGNITTYISL
jgi:vacuolar protein sorting-associated protein 13D